MFSSESCYVLTVMYANTKISRSSWWCAARSAFCSERKERMIIVMTGSPRVPRDPLLVISEGSSACVAGVNDLRGRLDEQPLTVSEMVRLSQFIHAWESLACSRYTMLR